MCSVAGEYVVRQPRLFPVASTVAREQLDRPLWPLLELAEEMGLAASGSGSVLKVRQPGSFPFCSFELLADDRAFQYWTLRTSSFDFGGERTDLHDVLSTALAVLLSCAAGLGSSLIDVLNPAVQIPGEVYSRHIVPGQPYGPLVRLDDLKKTGERLVWGLWLDDSLWRTLHHPDRCLCREENNVHHNSDWDAAGRSALGLDERADILVTSRNFPEWDYLRVARSGAALVRAPALVELLEIYRAPEHQPAELVTAEGRFLHAEGRRNVLPPGVERRAHRALVQLGDLGRGDQPTWVVLEDRVVALGNEHLVSLPAACDGAAHDHAHTRAQRRFDVERVFFSADKRFAWANPVDPQRFEELVCELLMSQEDVVRIRAVGTVNQPDRERDYVADWILTRQAVPKDDSPGHPARVVVQCKARKNSLGRSELPSISDLVVEHQADGFFLAVSSQLSSSAFDRMDALRRSSGYFVEWWDRAQIEHALRRAPSVAARYLDVVRPIDEREGVDATHKPR